MKSMKGLQQSKKQACLFYGIDHMTCKAIVPKTAVIVFLAMIKVIAMKLVKFFDCKVIETRPQVSYFYYLHASFCV